MKQEALVHFLALLVFSLVAILVNSWFEVRYVVFLLGGILGTILPDFDHLVYVYFLHPQDLSSQRAHRMLSQGQIWSALNFFADTRAERQHLIFHTIFFQLLILLIIFFVFTSTSSLFGKGIVLGFGLHLFVDQILDFVQTGNLVNWLAGNAFLRNFFDHDKTVYYLVASGIVLLILAVLL